MITVIAAAPDRRDAALSLLFSRRTAEERARCTDDVLAAERRGELCLDGLLLAEVDGQEVGAAFSALQPDGTGMVWPPVVAGPVSVDDVSDALLQRICRDLDAAGARMGQCIVELDETGERQALVRNGFVHFVNLCFLERSLDDPLPPPPDVEFETVPFVPSANTERFADVLERTYADTLDCPQLNGSRSGAESLESHRTAGEFDPSRWKIYRAAQADVGVLLLSDHPEQDAWEVVYVGVVPEARGKGIGRAMLLSGLYEARAAGRRAVMLAVDSGNKYARNIYADLGFQDVAVRAVHVRMRPRFGESE